MASKLAELKRTGGKAAAESVGVKPTVGIFTGEIAREPTPPPTSRMTGVKQLKGASRIDVARIIADPDQPRKEFASDELERMATSLVRHGQLQPIVVRWADEEERYVVIWGERRFRAAQSLGWPTIAAVVFDEGPDGEMGRLERQLVENCVREDLKPIEEANAFRRLMDAGSLTGEQLARLLSISPAKVSKALKLLELPEPVRAMVESGQLAASVAYEVAKSAEPEAMATRAVEEKMTREQVAEEVKPKASTSSIPNTGDLYGYYPKGAKLPTYFIRAQSESDAVRHAESEHPKGTPFDIIKWDGDLPRNPWIQVAKSRTPTTTKDWADEENRHRIPGQAGLPIGKPAPVKIETLDDTKTYHLGKGVMVVIEGPRDMIASPVSWLHILIGAIGEGRIDVRGNVIPRDVAKANAKKKGDRR